MEKDHIFVVSNSVINLGSGQIRITEPVVRNVPEGLIGEALQRFASGDWGAIALEEQQMNNDMKDTPGERIIGMYAAGRGLIIVVECIVEAFTLISLYEEYMGSL